ncbi:MAG: hypothetical protein GX197_03465 [Firmicutes bacterium]|nr:hypothetical protein [Bacillota bacterium]
MNKKFQQYKLQLEKMKQKLLEQISLTEGLQEHKGLREATAELSMVDNHPADLASENYERAKDLSLHEKNRLILEKVEEALARIEAGQYGRCKNCGKPIPEERLKAVPYTELCLACKKEAEEATENFTRPVEELILWPPFSRTYMGENDYTGYDGEDAWQDVDLYNKLNHVFERETVAESDETIGAVEDMERISNQDYEEQLPD